MWYHSRGYEYKPIFRNSETREEEEGIFNVNLDFLMVIKENRNVIGLNSICAKVKEGADCKEYAPGD